MFRDGIVEEGAQFQYRGTLLSETDTRLYTEGMASRPLRVVVFDFESSSSKKFEYRVAIAVVGSVILDVILISDIAVILSRLDWILK